MLWFSLGKGSCAWSKQHCDNMPKHYSTGTRPSSGLGHQGYAPEDVSPELPTLPTLEELLRIGERARPCYQSV